MDSSFHQSGSLTLDPTYNSGTLHHQRRGWVKLSLDILETNFPSIIAFAKRAMEVVPPNLVSVKVLYHEANERVDFLFQDKGRNPSFGVLVAFEPGYVYPEVAHDDDFWDSTVGVYLQSREFMFLAKPSGGRQGILGNILCK